ncbi:predicted protein [Nematostella vectensis]|uniref:Uncharacterized protein n=1 Tax=Nematostella vectensis TaxID=45351 RepID=A7SCK2_NEMVE|nr:predicted protein [Nematostella vectensis]|eukprot:XP_001630596.1 predicted protein [Nematostella vectensis]
MAAAPLPNNNSNIGKQSADGTGKSKKSRSKASKRRSANTQPARSDSAGEGTPTSIGSGENQSEEIAMQTLIERTWYCWPKFERSITCEVLYLLGALSALNFIIPKILFQILGKPIENKTKRLKKIYETYQLSQLLNEPTRITMHSKSLIDHFVTSCPDKINSSGVIHLGLSDHSLIYGIRKINPYKSSREKANTIEIRNMKKFNQELFARDLLAQPWEQIVLCPDAN